MRQLGITLKNCIANYINKALQSAKDVNPGLTVSLLQGQSKLKPNQGQVEVSVCGFSSALSTWHVLDCFYNQIVYKASRMYVYIYNQVKCAR